MKLTIYNTAVKMESQEQCDRMRALCLENKLPIWEYESAFEYFDELDYFIYDNGSNHFFVFELSTSFAERNNTIITEQEFINLLKQAK